MRASVRKLAKRLGRMQALGLTKRKAKLRKGLAKVLNTGVKPSIRYGAICFGAPPRARRSGCRARAGRRSPRSAVRSGDKLSAGKFAKFSTHKN